MSDFTALVCVARDSDDRSETASTIDVSTRQFAPPPRRWGAGRALGVLSSLFVCASVLTASVDTKPDLAIMERAADWQLAHPSEHPTTAWTQAAFYVGVMALSQVSENPRYLDAMMKVGEGNRWQLGPRMYHADDQAVGQMYAEMYLKKHDERMLAALKERCDYILAHPKTSSLLFDKQKNPEYLDRWTWCDALFMAPPAWVRLWSITGKPEYLNYAVENWWITSDHLYDQKDHLYLRDDSFVQKREQNGKKIYWSRGNGWVMGGLVRVLQLLPKDHASRPKFLQQFREMADSVIACQQPDGLWRSSLLDPDHYPLKETSGSGFFTYALAWGVNEGLLDAQKFKPVALKAWDGLVGCVDSDGKLTHVQPVGSDPKKFTAESTEVYGVGAFLLAGTEIIRLKAAK